MSDNRKVDPRQADTTKLAYIGDAVYELFVRKFVVESNKRVSANKINKTAIGYVSADAQAVAAKALTDQGILTEEEERLLKRARNRTNTTRPRGSTPSHYKLATGFEALIGFLYLDGDEERLNYIMNFAKGAIEESRASAKTFAKIARKKATEVIAEGNIPEEKTAESKEGEGEHRE